MRVSILAFASTFALALLAGCGGAPAAAPTETAPTCWGGNLDVCAKECDGGSATSCYDLAWFSEKGQWRDNPSRAVTLYVKSCEGGYAQACARLGFAYQRGDIVREDGAQAKTFLTKGCDGGIYPACGALKATQEQRMVWRDPDLTKASGGASTDASGRFSIGTDVSVPEAPKGPEAPKVDAPKVETPQTPAVQTPQAPSAPQGPSLPQAPTGPTMPQAPTAPTLP